MVNAMPTVVFGERPFDAELVIFDKDGTLTDFKKTWIPLLEKRIDIVREKLGLDVPRRELRDLIFKTFGVGDDWIDPYGPFPYTPPHEDEIVFATALYSLGVPWEKGKTVARHSIERAEEELDRRETTVLFEGVPEVLDSLKRAGLLLALATADLTGIAQTILSFTGIHGLFDYVVGADMVARHKPDPEMLHKILEALKVGPESSVLVGDSITDMEMGRRAGLGLVVGVTEGGIAAEQDLARDADLVIPSVRDIRVIT
ncbi:MAG: HAD family hydrolase [Spirochaetota bacterium]